MATYKYGTATNDPVNFNSKMGWGNVFERSYPTPLDRTELFMTYDDALAYATGGADSRSLSGTSYRGQHVTIVSGTESTVYVITPGRVYASGDQIPEGKKVGDENISTRKLVQIATLSSSGADIYWLNEGGDPING